MQNFAQSVELEHKISRQKLFSYYCVVPHSGQNFAVAERVVPHSEQNFPSVCFSLYAFPTNAELLTAPDGSYLSSSIRTG